MLALNDKDKMALVDWALNSICERTPLSTKERVEIGAIQIPTDKESAPIVIVSQGLDELARALGVEIQDFYGIKGRCRGFWFAGQAVMFLEGEESAIGTEK